jgi:hypothetical protein
VTIDCLPDCPHLIAAHRWEAEHRKPITAEEFPYRDISVSPDFVYAHWNLIAALATALLRFRIDNKDLTDGFAIVAIEALAETYRTLGTGIYYERPPDAPIARAVYGLFVQALQEFRRNQAAPMHLSSLKDSEVFHLLVFFLRIAKQETNGRPRTRAFLDFLQARFPLLTEAAPETPRIIIP